MISKEQNKSIFSIQDIQISVEIQQDSLLTIICMHPSFQDQKFYYQGVFTLKKYKQETQISAIYPTFQRLFKQLIKKSKQKSLKFLKGTIQVQVKIDDQINIYGLQLQKIKYRKLQINLMQNIKNLKYQLKTCKFQAKQAHLKVKHEQIQQSKQLAKIQNNFQQQVQLFKSQMITQQQKIERKIKYQDFQTPIQEKLKYKGEQNKNIHQLKMVYQLEEKIKFQQRENEINIQIIQRLKSQRKQIEQQIQQTKKKRNLQFKNFDELNQKNQSFQYILQQKQSQIHEKQVKLQMLAKQNWQLIQKLQSVELKLNHYGLKLQNLNQVQKQLKQKNIQLQKLIIQNQVNIQSIKSIQNQLKQILMQKNQKERQNEELKIKYQAKLKLQQQQFQEHKRNLQKNRKLRQSKNKVHSIQYQQDMKINPTDENAQIQILLTEKFKKYQLQKSESNKINLIKLIQALESNSKLQELLQLKQELVARRCKFLQNMTLPQFKNLKTINLYQSIVNQVQLKQICCLLVQLQQIILCICQDMKKVQICQSPKIKKAYISHARIDIFQFVRMPSLEFVSLIDCKQVKCIKFQQCPNLKTIKFHSFGINDEQLHQILVLQRNIQTIQYGSCESLKSVHLVGLDRLKSISFTHTKLSFLQCKELPQLQCVLLQECKQLNELKIQKCQQLSILKITNIPIAHNQLNKLIQQSTNLKQIHLKSCSKITQIAIQNLKKLKRILFSAIHPTSIHLACLPDLQDLIWQNSTLSNLKQFKILDCQNLKRLQLSSLLSSQFLMQQLMEPLGQNVNFQLKLYSAIQTKQAKINYIKKLKKLTVMRTSVNSLILSSKSIQEILFYENPVLSIKFQPSCQSIKKMTLNYVLINEQNLYQLLANCPQLQDLKIINGLNIKNVQFPQTCLTKIKKIWIANAHLIKINLKFLNQLKLLEEVYISKCSLKKGQKISIKEQNNFKSLTLCCASQICQTVQLQSLVNFTQLKINCRQLFLDNCDNIQKLTLQTQINQAELSQLLKKLPNLMQFQLTSASLKNIKICNKLKLTKLVLPTTIVSLDVKDMPQLIHLSLPESLVQLKISICNKINRLYFGGGNTYARPCIKLVQLKQMKQLVQIDLQRCKCLKQIKLSQCQNLTKLILSQTCVTQNCVQQFCNYVPNLQQLNLNGCVGIKSLKLWHLKKLRAFNHSATQLDLSDLPSLVQLKALTLLKVINCQNIRKLNLQYSKINDQQLSGILYQKRIINGSLNYISFKFPFLLELNLFRCQNQKFTKLQLKNIQRLQKINLKGSFIIDLVLQELPQLRQVNLNYECKRLNCIKITNCKHFKKIDFSSLSVSVIEIANLNQLQQLTTRSFLKLKQYSVTNCPKLFKMQLQSSSITDDQLQKLCMNLPNISHLNLDNCQKLKQYPIANCKYLKHLNLTYAYSLNDQKLNKLLQHQSMQSLDELILYGCKQLKQFKLNKLKNIKKLELSYTSINDEQIIELSKKCGLFLEQLTLYSCNIVDIVKVLLSSVNLKKININKSSIKDQHIRQIKKLAPALQIITK